MGDRLTRGLQLLIKKYNLPFVAFNQGSICHLDNAGTMHFCIDWKKPWTIPEILKQTSIRQKEMEHPINRHIGWLPPVYQRGLYRGDDR